MVLCTYTQAPTEASGVRSPEVEVGTVEASEAMKGTEPRSPEEEQVVLIPSHLTVPRLTYNSN